MLRAELRPSKPTIAPLVAATLVAAVAAVAVWGLARATGAELLVDGRDGPATQVPLSGVLLATVVGGIAAAGVAGLARRTARPRRTVAVVGAVGLVLTAVPPLRAAQDTATGAWLIAMHVVVAAVLLPVVWRRVPAVTPVTGQLRG